MLPGLINQVNIDWDNTKNYNIPTVKRYGNKVYLWLAPNGPQLGGVKTPGTSAGSAYWQNLDDIVAPRTQYLNENNWNNIKNQGKYFILSTANVTANAPLNVTAWWWLEVSNCYHGSEQVLQEAHMHSLDNNAAQIRSRCFNGSSWGTWVYTYSQYAG